MRSVVSRRGGAHGEVIVNDAPGELAAVAVLMTNWLSHEIIIHDAVRDDPITQRIFRPLSRGPSPVPSPVLGPSPSLSSRSRLGRRCRGARACARSGVRTGRDTSLTPAELVARSPRAPEQSTRCGRNTMG